MSHLPATYPAEITAQLSALVQVFRRVLGDNLISLMLVGSAARGELTFTHTDRLEVLSDYEFIAVVKSRHAVAEHALDRAIEETIRTFGFQNHLFHVDYALRTPRQLQRLSHTLFTFEAKQTALTLFGSDFTHLMPVVTLQDINRADLREIIIHRLAAMANALDPALYLGGANSEQIDQFRYSLCRNALDILTLVLPYSGNLIATFRRRLDALHNAAQEPYSPYFDDEFVPFMEECLQGKLALTYSRPVLDLYERVLRYLLATLRYVTGMPPEADLQTTLEGVEKASGSLFDGNGRTIRYIYESYVFVVKARAPVTKIRWLFVNKRKKALSALFHLHFATLSRMKGDEAAARQNEGQLQQALAGLMLDSPSNGSLSGMHYDLRRSLPLIYPYLRKKVVEPAHD